MTSFKDLPLCTIDSCSEVQEGHGYCRRHYFNWLKTGEPERRRKMVTHEKGVPSPYEMSFESRTKQHGDCLVWTGNRRRGRAGILRVGGQEILAYRYAWEQENGPLHRGQFLRQTCSTPFCVLPAHHELY